MRFPIRLDPRFRWLLLLFGVRRRNAYVELDGDNLIARFGFYGTRTIVSNIERWEIGGPYKWYRAIGVRASLGKPEITYGGSAHGGVALFFRQPIRTRWMARLLVLYVTLDDLEGFAAELTKRGIEGRDVRARPTDRAA